MKKISILLGLCIIFMISDTLFAQSKLIKSVGIGGGVSLPQGGWDPGNTIMLQADFGEVIDYLFLFPFLSYAQAKKNETIEDYSKDLSILYFGGGAKLVGYINSKPRGFYFGASLSYYYINAESFDPDYISEFSEIDETKTTKIGFGGLIGYKFALKRVSIFIETDYMFMQGGYNNFFGMLGLNYSLE